LLVDNGGWFLVFGSLLLCPLVSFFLFPCCLAHCFNPPAEHCFIRGRPVTGQFGLFGFEV
jgi:hypothetical protein